MSAAWITSEELAPILGVSRRAISKAAKLGYEGLSWKGVVLAVRRTKNILGGGRSGWAYQVRVDSLPCSLQAALNDCERPVQLALKLDDKADAAAAWWHAVLCHALRADKGSDFRTKAIQAIVAAEHIRNGARVRLSESTVRRMIKRFDKQGHGGLHRKKREGIGEKTVVITRKWDAATTRLSDGVRKGIAADLAKYRRSLWGNGTSYGDVKRLASEFLADATANAGIALTDAELLAACELPKHVVEIGRASRDVHEFRTDRKSWDDKRARVRLTSSGLAPMQIVYGDVHHFDIYLEREDGSKATPKGIAWLDAATRRVRMDIVLCEPGTAIRNEDVIDSFISMTQDPYWGMPARLYLDNGSEYAFADLAKDALRLAGLECFTFGDTGTITRAQAYNAAAKGILKGSFGIFERTIQASLPGYIGGNRMQSRSANLGKAPMPYPGSFEGFCAQQSDLMRYWMTRAQQGDLKGLSPEQALAGAIEAGWQRTDVDQHALLMAFSIEDTRKVVDGKISFAGEKLYCDGLAAFNGQKVRVRLPKYHRWPGVPVFPLKGTELIGVAMTDQVYRRDDPAGAVEAARRKKVAVEAIKAKAATIEPLDVAEVMAASGRRQKLPPEPKSGGYIGLADDHATAGRQIVETPADRHNREHAERQRKQKARLDLLLSREKKGDRP